LTPEEEELKRVTDPIVAELKSSLKEPIESRKKNFKFLMLRWHPDKNQDNLEEATKVFQFIQAQKDWYLEEK